MIIRLVKMALCCLGSLEVEAKILKTKHVEEILPLIDEDTWFLVDLDNCNEQSTGSESTMKTI